MYFLQVNMFPAVCEIYDNDEMYRSSLIDQVVEDIPPPVPHDLSMVLIKPQEACPTGEVYKVI